MIPIVDNRTPVLILQHRRERFHSFNTARIVRQSLQRFESLVDHHPELDKRFGDFRLSPRAGLLYPGDDAVLLPELSPASPGRYRIRREPKQFALSTVEATVAALSILGSETKNLESLAEAFHRIIDDQLSHKSCDWRRNERRRPTGLDLEVDSDEFR